MAGPFFDESSGRLYIQSGHLQRNRPRTGLKVMGVRVYWNTFLARTCLPSWSYRHANWTLGLRDEMVLDQHRITNVRWSVLYGHHVGSVSYSTTEDAFLQAQNALAAMLEGGVTASCFYDPGVETTTDLKLVCVQTSNPGAGTVLTYNWIKTFSEITDETEVDLSEASDFLDARSWDDVPVNTARVWDFGKRFDNPRTLTTFEDVPISNPDDFYADTLLATGDTVSAFSQFCNDRSVSSQSISMLTTEAVLAAYIPGNVGQFSSGTVHEPSRFAGYIQRVKGVMSPHCEAVFGQNPSGGLIDTGIADPGCGNLFKPNLGNCGSIVYGASPLSCGTVIGNTVHEPSAHKAIVIPIVDQSLFPCCND